MKSGRPFIPQHEQKHRIVQGPWSKYLKYLDGDEPAKIAILATFRDFELAGIAITDETAEAAVKLGRLHYRQAREKRLEEERRREERTAELNSFRKLLEDHPEGIVYYTRRGDAIKIGTTVNYTQRMRDLMPDEILAIEPGSYSVEHERHQQFQQYAYFTVRSEYFCPGEELKKHILRLREEYGIPDQSPIRVTDGKRLFEDDGRVA